MAAVRVDVVAQLTALFAARYLAGVGLSVLLYDHALTFSEEVELVWKAPNTASKWAFLFNRYLVPLLHLSNASQMAFNAPFSITEYVPILTFRATAGLGIISIAIANVLVLLRITQNWDWNRNVMLLLTGGFAFGFGSQNVALIVALRQIYPGIMYNRKFRMCIVTNTSPALVAMWAFPILFELLVLGSSFWNVLDRPRDARIALRTALFHDGVGFFMILMLLRTVNLILASAGRGRHAFIAIYLVWAVITMTLNRALLFFRRQDTRKEPTAYEAPDLHASSPVGTLRYRSPPRYGLGPPMRINTSGQHGVRIIELRRTPATSGSSSDHTTYYGSRF